MFVAASASGHRCRQKVFGENHAGTEAGAEGAMVALSDAIESVAGSHHPGIRSRPLQVLAKVFKRRWMFGRQGSKVVEGFVDAGRQARGGHVMSENSAIYDLGKECRLRDEFANQVRDVFLAFRRECFLIPRAAAKSYDHNFSLLGQRRHMTERARVQQRAPERHSCRSAQEVPAAPRDLAGDFLRGGGTCSDPAYPVHLFS